MSAKQVLANAKIQLEVKIEDVSHFRPRKGERDAECAIIRLSPTGHGPFFAKIFDEREDSVFISRGMANIRTAEKAAKTLLDQKKVEQAKAEAHESWPDYFGLNASVYLDFEEAVPGHRIPILVLRDPDESKTAGLLTTVLFDKDHSSSFAVRQSRDSWLRMVLARDKEEENTNHFLLLTVTSKESPIAIFHRLIDGKKLVATDYLLTDERRIIRREATITKEEWLEGEPLPEAPASFEEEALEEPEEEPSPDQMVDKSKQIDLTVGKNGKVETYCPKCDKIRRIGAKKLEKGQARCPKCNTLLE